MTSIITRRENWDINAHREKYKEKVVIYKKRGLKRNQPPDTLILNAKPPNL